MYNRFSCSKMSELSTAESGDQEFFSMIPPHSLCPLVQADPLWAAACRVPPTLHPVCDMSHARMIYVTILHLMKHMYCKQCDPAPCYCVWFLA